MASQQSPGLTLLLKLPFIKTRFLPLLHNYLVLWSGLILIIIALPFSSFKRRERDWRSYDYARHSGLGQKHGFMHSAMHQPDYGWYEVTCHFANPISFAILF